MDVPKTHPRYHSLLARKKLADAFRKGMVVPQGLIAQGRGEAFDYLLGERTIPPARQAEKAAAAYLVLAENPVVSVNGNVAALAAGEVVRLANAIPARIEVNLFYRTAERVRQVADCLRIAGAREVLGTHPNARIPGLDSKRALCSRNGIFLADTVLIPLEDGDRAQALARMGKVTLAIDLNPMSRTSLAATVTIVDELTRAVANITDYVKLLKRNRDAASRIVMAFDKESNLKAINRYIASRFDVARV